MARILSNAVEIVEDQHKIETSVLREQIVEAIAERDMTQMQLEEALSGLDLMIDNYGWAEIGAYQSDDGPSLKDVKDSAKQIRNLTALNAHMKRGLTLRQSYILQGGMVIEGAPSRDDRRSSTVNVQALIDDPVNAKNCFSDSARRRREGAFYTAGNVAYIGVDESTTPRATPKRLYALPIWEVGGHYCNPDDSSEIWAIRRVWQHFPQSGVPEERAEWIFLNGHVDKRTRSINYNGKAEPVAQNKRIFWADVNRQEGWAFGLPDALAAMQWARQYRELVLSGKKMTDALATLAFKIKSSSAAGAKSAATKTAGTTQKGVTAAMPEGTDVAALATAGKAYDFGALRPVLSIMATALEVSVVALSSDPGAAGSSYGSAQTLDVPTKLAMLARRMVHVELEKEILRWFGWQEPVVYFEALEDGAEMYRQVQALLLPFLQGLYEPQEARDRIDNYFGWPTGTVPTGVLTPNNAASLARRDLDTDVPAQTPAADQGVSDGVGGQGGNSGTDIRTDTLS